MDAPETEEMLTWMFGRGVAAGKGEYKAELGHYFPDMHEGRGMVRWY